jgi:glycerol-3-phosphate acyltransferase PlsY
VILFDVLKGFLPVFLGLKFFPDERMAFFAGFLAVLGHCFPIFIKFRGGKGVATSVGVYSVVAPIPLLIGMAIFLGLVILTRYVSVGSILAALSLPLSIYFIQGDAGAALLAAAIFVLVIIRHLGNIQRLMNGSEKKFGERA